MPKMRQMHHPTSTTSVQERLSTPCREHAAVVVCGGGPAGIAAAISAARTQTYFGLAPNVRLIETHGQLGGIWTSGLLSWILDGGNKRGLMCEVLERIEAHRVSLGGRPTIRSGQLYDTEHMKLLLEQMCRDAGVRVRLHTRVVATQKSGRHLTHIMTESKSGREAFGGACFVDCTGDGDLAAQAGCEYEVGRLDPDQQGRVLCQPMTLMALVTGIGATEARPFFDRRRFTSGEVKAAFLEEFRRAGVHPSYANPTLFEVYPDLFAIMANHEYEKDPFNAQDVTDATIAARHELHTLTAALRGLGGPWRDLRLVATAAQIGIRESRRPAGLYRITLDDLVAGRRHDDAVCECRFGIDVHATTACGNGSIEPKPVPRTLPYDIPYRALIARDVDRLLMAGRCISGDFFAHASYRVTGNAVPMGEAAGCAAALAVARGCLPGDLDYAAEVRPIQEAIFPHDSPLSLVTSRFQEPAHESSSTF